MHKHHSFTPDPRAAMHDEIMRLATLKGWSHKTIMKRRTEALAAELALYGDGKDRLDRWQQLCVEVGVADLNDVPKSITACKKVCPTVWDKRFLTVFDKRAEAQSGAHQHLQPCRPPTQSPDDPSSPLQLLLRSLFVHPGRSRLPETNSKAERDRERTAQDDISLVTRGGRSLRAALHLVWDSPHGLLALVLHCNPRTLSLLLPIKLVTRDKRQVVLSPRHHATYARCKEQDQISFCRLSKLCTKRSKSISPCY
jgi:hypothetical protein